MTKIFRANFKPTNIRATLQDFLCAFAPLRENSFHAKAQRKREVGWVMRSLFRTIVKESAALFDFS
jgi:hypothetical protein